MQSQREGIKRHGKCFLKVTLVIRTGNFGARQLIFLERLVTILVGETEIWERMPDSASVDEAAACPLLDVCLFLAAVSMAEMMGHLHLGFGLVFSLLGNSVLVIHPDTGRGRS